MSRIRELLAAELPQLSAYFQSGSLVDGVLNLGLAAPIDVQVSGSNLHNDFLAASEMAQKIRALPDVGDVFIPQDLDYPALKLNIDRTRVAKLGLSQREVVGNL